MIRAHVTLACDAHGCLATCPGTARAGFGPLYSSWTDVVVDPEYADWRRAGDFSDRVLCPQHAPEFAACSILGLVLRWLGPGKKL